MKARLITKKALGAVTAAVMMLNSWGAFSVFAADVNADYNNVFTFSDSAITAEDTEGSGFKIKGTDLTINESGTYVVTGTCAEGSITVKKGTTDVVLILDSITLTSSTTAPLSVNKGAEAEIVVKGTNTLTDAEDPANETSTDEAVADAFEGAAIKVKAGSTATITGTGTLTADGTACKNGIKGGEEASIIIGESTSDTFTLNVKAANNALASDGSVTVNGGTTNIASTGDGLKSSPDPDEETGEVTGGYVTINNGTVNITAGEDGIQADQGFTMNGGTVDITAAGGHTKTVTDGGKGIKSDAYINITGGTVDIDSADDGIHLNGTAGTETVSITGGTVTVAAGDDGIHSDYYLNIGTDGSTTGPYIEVTNSYEGLEGAIINLYSGSGKVYSSDDGVNAANGDLTSYNFALNIFGGQWYIDANGDGLDSNGNINISGGSTEVFGSSMGDNAALDYGDFNASFNVTGGSVIGVGMSNMATVPTSGKYIVFGQSGGMGGPGGQGGFNPGGQGGQGGRGGQGGFTPGTQDPSQQTGEQSGTAISVASGTSIVIKNSSGDVVYSGTGTKSANHIVYASDALVEGETYTLYLNGVSAATATTATGNGQATQGPGGQQGPGGEGGQPTPPDQNMIKGDIDGNGQVDYLDISLLTSIIAGEVEFTEMQKMAADMDNSQILDYIDLNMIINFINQ